MGVRRAAEEAGSVALEKTNSAWQGVHEATYEAAKQGQSTLTSNHDAAGAAEVQCAHLRSALQLDLMLASIPGMSEAENETLRGASSAAAESVAAGWDIYAHRVSIAAKVGGAGAAERVADEEWDNIRAGVVAAVMGVVGEHTTQAGKTVQDLESCIEEAWRAVEAPHRSQVCRPETKGDGRLRRLFCDEVSLACFVAIAAPNHLWDQVKANLRAGMSPFDQAILLPYYHIWTYNPRFYSLFCDQAIPLPYYHIWTYNPRFYSLFCDQALPRIEDTVVDAASLNAEDRHVRGRSGIIRAAKEHAEARAEKAWGEMEAVVIANAMGHAAVERMSPALAPRAADGEEPMSPLGGGGLDLRRSLHHTAIFRNRQRQEEAQKAMQTSQKAAAAASTMRDALRNEWGELVATAKHAAEQSAAPRTSGMSREHRRDEIERMRQWNQVTHRDVDVAAVVAMERREKRSFADLLDEVRAQSGDGKAGAWEEEIIRMWYDDQAKNKGVPLSSMLITAVESGHLEMARLLLAAGADVHAVDCDERPLEVVVERCPGKKRHLMWALIQASRDREEEEKGGLGPAAAAEEDEEGEEGMMLVQAESWKGGAFIEEGYEEAALEAASSSEETDEEDIPIRRETSRF